MTMNSRGTRIGSASRSRFRHTSEEAATIVAIRRRALERLHGLIERLGPLDRQVMLLYLEQLDAASITEIEESGDRRWSGLSAPRQAA
jgi:hypothetical protein